MLHNEIATLAGAKLSPMADAMRTERLNEQLKVNRNKLELFSLNNNYPLRERLNKLADAERPTNRTELGLDAVSRRANQKLDDMSDLSSSWAQLSHQVGQVKQVNRSLPLHAHLLALF